MIVAIVILKLAVRVYYRASLHGRLSSPPSQSTLLGLFILEIIRAIQETVEVSEASSGKERLKIDRTQAVLGCVVL